MRLRRRHRPGAGRRWVMLLLAVGALAAIAAAGPASAAAAPSPDPGVTAAPPPTTTSPPTPPESGVSPSPPAGPDRPSSIPPTADPDEAGEPGLFDISGRIRDAMVDLFAWLVADALNPILGALGETLLATPDLTGNPHVLAMWSTTRTIANGLLILAVLAAAFLLTGHETVQTRYGFKELAPRLVVAAVLANASLPLCRAAITSPTRSPPPSSGRAHPPRPPPRR